MQFLDRLIASDRERCVRLMATAPNIRTHRALYNWLRGDDMQHLLPHDIMLAAWGNIHNGHFEFDVVSAVPGVSTKVVDADKLLPRVQQLFARWTEQREHAIEVDGDALNGVFTGSALAGRATMVHGLHDLRAGQDCLYAVVSHSAGGCVSEVAALAALLPHIDLGFRQVAALPRRATRPTVNAYHERAATMLRMQAEQITVPAVSGLLSTTAMTERELQIMRWVEMGKTNHEIGTILDISAFTVKNHLQRIFKKLDVYSRAQAVSRFKDSMLHG